MMKKLLVVLLLLTGLPIQAADIPGKDAALIKAAGIPVYPGAVFATGNQDVGYRFVTSEPVEKVRKWYQERLKGWSVFNRYGHWMLHVGKPVAHFGDIMKRNRISINKQPLIPSWHNLPKDMTTELVIVVPSSSNGIQYHQTQTGTPSGADMPVNLLLPITLSVEGIDLQKETDMKGWLALALLPLLPAMAARLSADDIDNIRRAGIPVFPNAVFATGSRKFGYRFVTRSAVAEVRRWYRNRLPNWHVSDRFGVWTLHPGDASTGIDTILSGIHLTVRKETRIPRWHGMPSDMTTEIVIAIPDR